MSPQQDGALHRPCENRAVTRHAAPSPQLAHAAANGPHLTLRHAPAGVSA